MRWIPLFALIASCAVVSFGAETEASTAVAAAAEEPKLEGVVVARSGGGFMTLTMNGPALVLRFYDAEKKAITPDVQGANVRFRFPSRREERRVLQLADDGQSMSHGRPVRPPFVFKAFITLLIGEGEEGTESYQVDYP